MILKDTSGVVQPLRASGKFPVVSSDYVFVPSIILPPTPSSQPNVSEPLPLPTPDITPPILTHVINIPPPQSTQTIATSITETFIVSVPILEQPLIPPPSSTPQLQTTPISPPLIVSAPQPTNPNVTPPRISSAMSVSNRHVSEGTPEEMFDYELEITSPESPPPPSFYPLIPPSLVLPLTSPESISPLNILKSKHHPLLTLVRF
ncbi:proline-rich receptor-like protein kinase PERK2 [Lathyrus oleraceus]|uniref:proline-rich receptor-like protein kinase PERK2 n=1 Tax=Pisum sativum TaxID=3888 RepID=UPI0021D1A346|nr:proline-rich receptor-like protein kinase PERK2 [Pisum sativum]